MKFQIVTYDLPEPEAIATGHTHVAHCTPPSWLGSRLRILGDSKEDAKERVVRYLQMHLNTLQSEGGELTEVDLEPPAMNTKDTGVITGHED